LAGIVAVPLAVFFGIGAVAQKLPVWLCALIVGILGPGYGVASLIQSGRLSAASQLPLWAVAPLWLACNAVVYSGTWLAMRYGGRFSVAVKLLAAGLWISFLVGFVLTVQSNSSSVDM
jgi:hypothetical protein